MAKRSPSSQETSASVRAGGRQAIVEMCAVSSTSLSFWSRHRFPIGDELQMRVHREALPEKAGSEPWVMLRGFVVQCLKVRQADGCIGFRVVILLDSALFGTDAAHDTALLPLPKDAGWVCEFSLN